MITLLQNRASSLSSAQRASAFAAAESWPRDLKNAAEPRAPTNIRERLVEGRLPRRVEGVVGELVNDRVREVERIGAQRRGEQRIVEQAKRAERTDADAGRRRTPASLRVFCRAARRIEVEVALVRDAADDRKPPGIGLESVAVRGRQHQHERVVIEA